MSEKIVIATRGENVTDELQAEMIKHVQAKKDKIRLMLEKEYPEIPFIVLFEDKLDKHRTIVAMNAGASPSIPFYVLWERIQKMGRETVTKNCICGECK